jgi:hypothetical protein
MAVNLQDGTKGLFDILGKVFFAQSTINTSRLTTVPDQVKDIYTQVNNLTAVDLEAEHSFRGVPDALETYRRNTDAFIGELQDSAESYLIHVVDSDDPLTTKNAQKALDEIAQQMDSSSDTVESSVVSVAVTTVGTAGGNGKIVASVKRGDGKTQEFAYAEVIDAEVTTAGPDATISLLGEEEQEDALHEDWPLGSGADTTIVSVGSSSRSVIVANGGFEDEDDNTGYPDDWYVSVGTQGTTFRLSTIEVQTVEIGGTPTGGHYFLLYTDANSDVHSTEQIPFNATAGTVQAKLRKIKGLEKITVSSGSTTTPNFTHTITFVGVGGNITELTSTNNLTGGTGVNEKQTVTITGSPDGGTFTLTYDGQTTAGIAYDATTDAVDSALEALSNIADGDVVVTGGPLPDTAIVVEFVEALAATDVAEMTISTASLTKTAAAVSVTETVKGEAAANEVQTITLYGATGGSIRIGFGAEQTDLIAYNAANATVETELEELSGIAVGNLTIGSGPLPAATTVTFGGTQANTDVSTMTIDVSELTTSISATVAETTKGVTAKNEINYIGPARTDRSTTHEHLRITGSSAVTGGTFTLTHDGNTTSAIAYDATPLEVLQALEALSSIDAGDLWIFDPTADNVLPAATNNTIDLVFMGPIFATNEPDITLDGTGLTGGLYTIAVLVQGTGAADPTITGTFQIRVGGPGSDTTAALSVTSSASAIQSALEGLASVGTGNVTVTKLGSGTDAVNASSMKIEWAGTLKETNVAPQALTSGASGGDILLRTQQNGDAGGTNEVQTITVAGTPTQGTFTVSYLGQTATFDYDESAATAETKLEALSTIGTDNVAVTGGALPGTALTITFQNTLGNTDVDMLVIDDTLLKASVAVTTPGDAGTNEKQTLSLTGSPTGGTTTLTFDSQTTGNIAYDATAAVIRSSLLALSSLDDITVTGGPWPNTAVVVEFKGGDAATDVALITATESFTQTAVAGTVVTTREGSASSATITHVTTTAGTAQVFRGGRSFEYDSNGAELTTIDQKLSLEAETVYAVSLWAICDVIPAAGVFTVDLVDGIGGTVINDDESTANSLTFNAASLTTSWQHLSDLVSGEVFFRTPRVLPDNVYLRVRISTAVSSGTSVWIDEVAMKKADEIYAGGPWIAAFDGSDAFDIGDLFAVTVSNDRSGLLHEWLNRNYDMRENRQLLPVAGSPTIPDSVVA